MSRQAIKDLLLSQRIAIQMYIFDCLRPLFYQLYQFIISLLLARKMFLHSSKGVINMHKIDPVTNHSLYLLDHLLSKPKIPSMQHCPPRPLKHKHHRARTVISRQQVHSPPLNHIISVHF